VSYFCKMADLGVAYRAWHVFLGKAIHAYRVKHPREPLTRDCLAKIMGEPFHKALSEANIISGFKTAFNRDAIMSKLSRNTEDSTLSAVVMDRTPIRGLQALAKPSATDGPVPHFTPSSALSKRSRASLVRSVSSLEKELADARKRVADLERARAGSILRPPLADPTEPGDLHTPPKPRRAMGALRSQDSGARLVTSTDLRAQIEADLVSKAAKKGNPRTKKASSSSSTAVSRAQPTVQVVDSDEDEEENVLLLDEMDD